MEALKLNFIFIRIALVGNDHSNLKRKKDITMKALNACSIIEQSPSFKAFAKSKVVKPLRFIPIMYVPCGYLADVNVCTSTAVPLGIFYSRFDADAAVKSFIDSGAEFDAFQVIDSNNASFGTYAAKTKQPQYRSIN